MNTDLIISAASSLTNVLTELGKTFEKENQNIRIQFNFAASGVLLQQIRQGAPVDIFISASPQEMDILAREKKIVNKTRHDLVGNRLVLIAPVGSRLKNWEELATSSVTQVALSQPDFVPAGRYAKETLIHRGLWKAVAPKAVFGQNVRQTLAYVVGGNVDAGVVFATDAILEKRIRVVATAIPIKDHEPILYPLTILQSSANLELAQRFIIFVTRKSSQKTFTRFGFTHSL